MSSRRKFIQNTSLAMAGILASPYVSKAAFLAMGKKKNIGIQLYTVRDLMDNNPIETLKQVASIGYNQLELANYADGKFYGYAAKEFKKITEDLGLDIISSHVSLDFLKNSPQEAIDACLASDHKYMVMPWLNEDQRSSIDKYKQHIEVLNNVSELCQGTDLTLCYHNHDFEFMPIDGQIPMDLILAETDADKVKIELDLYWISKVGLSPIDFFKANPGRCPLWHVKDMDSSPTQNFTEVGNGVINFKEIFAAAKTAGMQHFFVEQDQSDDPMKSIEVSFGNVREM